MTLTIDITLKLAIAILGSSSSTSLANENKSFIVYPLVVIGLTKSLFSVMFFRVFISSSESIKELN